MVARFAVRVHGDTATVTDRVTGATFTYGGDTMVIAGRILIHVALADGDQIEVDTAGPGTLVAEILERTGLIPVTRIAGG